MSKKVEGLGIESMNNGQSSEFHTTNIARAKADANIVADLGPQLTAWENANNQFDIYLKQEQKSLLTEDIKDLDSVQDDDLVALKGVSRAMMNIPDEEKKQSARRVKLCIDNYDINTEWEYIKEMQLIKQMVDDLQGRYAADVAALGIGIFVEKLAQSNAAVRAAQIQRENEAAGKTTGQTRAWRRETEKAYRAFVEMLNARALVFGDANYANFIDLLNASIAHYRQILAVAAGIRAAKNGENSDSSKPSSSNSGSSTTTPVEADTTNQGGSTSNENENENENQNQNENQGGSGSGTSPDPSQGGENGGSSGGSDNSGDNSGSGSGDNGGSGDPDKASED